jgi:hypothetical protein
VGKFREATLYKKNEDTEEVRQNTGLAPSMTVESVTIQGKE